MDGSPPTRGANNVQFKSGDRIGGSEPVDVLGRRRNRDSADAVSEIGHTARVCGLVAAANYEPDTRAHPTFLTLI